MSSELKIGLSNNEFLEELLKKLKNRRYKRLIDIDLSSLTYKMGVYCLYEKLNNRFINRYTGKACMEAQDIEEINYSSCIRERLRIHKNTLKDRQYISLENIYCKYLVFDKDYSFNILMAEVVLIKHFKPAWNVEIKGFGCVREGKRGGEWVKKYPLIETQPSIEIVNILNSIKHDEQGSSNNLSV